VIYLLLSRLLYYINVCRRQNVLIAVHPSIIQLPQDEKFHSENFVPNGKHCSNAEFFLMQLVQSMGHMGHIRIHCPVDKHDEYINHKIYSIQLQAVADSFGLFMDVFIGFPGSVHDTRVLKNSPLYRNINNYPPLNYYLLGDSGYPCRLAPIAIMTPFKSPNRQQKQFNTCLSRARIVVEWGALQICQCQHRQ
jgi:hypothetical protein